MVVAVFLIAVVKSSTGASQGRKGLFCLTGFRDSVHQGREGMQQVHEVAGHIEFKVGKRRENTSALLIFI